MGKPWLLYKLTGDNYGSGTKSRKKGGCMTAIFHLFHHHQPSNFISQTFIHIPQESTNIILKGVEAPRNSLELEEQEPEFAAISSSKLNQQTNISNNIPISGEFQIKTKRLEDESSSQCSSRSSAATKTPNLVARLMGLDLLPEYSSPRPSSSSSYTTPLNTALSKSSSYNKNNSRSLPVTPRVSTAARSSTEIDQHHRLSLQIVDESTSKHANQIAKQVMENIISRPRVAADVKNTVKKKEQIIRRDELLMVLKSKRKSQPLGIRKSRNLDQRYGRGKENEPIPHSCSPRLRFLNIENILNYKHPNSNSSKSSPLSTVMKEEAVQVVVKPMKVQKCKRLKRKMHQQQREGSFVKSITPLMSSNRPVNVNTTTKFLSLKKHMASHSLTILPQTKLPSSQSKSYNSKEIHKLSVQDKNQQAAAESENLIYDYISKILSHSGIEKTTQISIIHWYSPSHPLHPTIFHQIEKNIHPAVNNRKLIFHVADELLVDILKPYINLKPWALARQNSRRMYGSELIEKLCEKICRFPTSDCCMSEKIVVDVFEDEVEELVTEIERDLVDTLVGEVAGIIWHAGFDKATWLSHVRGGKGK